MICIVGDRQTGKTTKLIELSAATKIPILAPNRRMADYIDLTVHRMGKDAPRALCMGPKTFARGRARREAQVVLVDEVSMFFQLNGYNPVIATCNAADFKEFSWILPEPTMRDVLGMWWRGLKRRLKGGCK